MRGIRPLVVFALSAVAAVPALSQGVPRQATPDQYQQRSKRPVRLPAYFGAAITAGRKWYVCQYCGTSSYDALTVTGRGGIQLADARLLLGAEAIVHLNGEERAGFLLLSGNGLAFNRRLMIGAGFGFAGIRVPVVANGWYNPNFTPAGWTTYWGLGADVHMELLVPVSQRMAIAPRISYSASLDGPIEYGSSSNPVGFADISLFQIGMGVLWRSRTAQ